MDNNKWRRLYMQSEKERRACKTEMGKIVSNLKHTAQLMKSEIQFHKRIIATQRKNILEMQRIMAENRLPVKNLMATFKLKKASDDEICPLSLAKINETAHEHIPGPFDPLKPDHKCAQLECGHRFSVSWLMYHFIKQSTFRCPVCRQGAKDFSFSVNDVPDSLKALFEKSNSN
jgi:hypothetical protein